MGGFAQTALGKIYRFLTGWPQAYPNFPRQLDQAIFQPNFDRMSRSRFGLLGGEKTAGACMTSSQCVLN